MIYKIKSRFHTTLLHSLTKTSDDYERTHADQENALQINDSRAQMVTSRLFIATSTCYT